MRLQRALIVLLLLLFSACKATGVFTETPDTDSNIERLLILPFKDMPKVYGANANVKCPVCGNFIMTGEIAEDAVDVLTDHLFSLLQNNSDYKLIPPGQARGVQSNLLSGAESSLAERDFLVATGRALKSDAVVAGYIFRYKERVGTRYASDSPASVAFDLHLIRVTDGRVLWSGRFNETQRSLSEDLLSLGTFIKRKARWITAHEMAQAGLEDLLQTFPGFEPRNKEPAPLK
jgi:hypothetical protein